MPVKPYVLSIAGFDPSAGAGILADIKTFESNGVYGLGICSANTIQSDITFEQVNWIDLHTMTRQIELLQKRFQFDFVKIGLVKNLHDLKSLISFLRNTNPAIKIVWDPVFKASAGFEFHKKIEEALLLEICKEIYLICPNLPEAETICSPDKTIKTIKDLSNYCSVYLKGGHSESNVVTDILYLHEGETHCFKDSKIKNGDKHGSGCVLSSAIVAYLALGKDLNSACGKAKIYISHFIQSTDRLLGYHMQLKMDKP